MSRHPRPTPYGTACLAAVALRAARSRTVAAVIDWMFRDRRTGGLTVAQVPNATLIVFLVVTGLRLLASPHGSFRMALDVVATVALVWWAGDEVIRGVNPFRRMLGAAVLAALLIGSLR
jgi:hypothetical protein